MAQQLLRHTIHGESDSMEDTGVPSSDETLSNFKLFIAMDFGTDGIGLAYAWNKRIDNHSKWKSKRFAPKIKPKTIILLKKSTKKAVSFGMDARQTYMDIGRDDDDYLLFERFKMSLYAHHEMNTPFDSDDDSDNEINCEEEAKKSSESKPIPILNISAFGTFSEYFTSLSKLILNKNDDMKEAVVIKQGWLQKQCGFLKKWKNKYVRIEDKNLCAYDNENCAKCTFKIDLTHIELLFTHTQSTQFILRKKLNDYTSEYIPFRCDNETETQSWIQCIDDIEHHDLNQIRDRKREYKIEINDTLTAVNGEQYDSEFVFVAAFKHLQKLANEYISHPDRKWTVAPEQIQWIITVPAIWNDEAKNKMKQWAISAGLVNPNIKDQCKIVYEPDCAALSIQHQIYENKKKQETHSLHLWLKDIGMEQYLKEFVDNGYCLNKLYKECQMCLSCDYFNFIGENRPDHVRLLNCCKQLDEIKIAAYDEQQLDIDIQCTKEFAIGEKYVLIDAGGGTVDVACHEILGEFGVKEIIHPSGGKWGSTFIDDEYIKLMKQIFVDEIIDIFIKEEPSVYIELIHYFQTAKAEFFKNPKQKTHAVKVPIVFLRYLDGKLSTDNYDGSYVFDVVASFEFNGEPNLIRLYDKGKLKKQQPKLAPQELMKRWNLEEYEDKLIKDEGYEDIEDWSDITLAELKEMGFRTGHAKKFVRLVNATMMNHNGNNSEGVEDEEYWLEIDVKIWKTLFDHVINPTIKHVKKLLKKPRLSENCRYLCLVGGLSSSRYFQFKMRQTFGTESKYNLDIIIPKPPILAVVRGAAYFAITDNYIRSRILKRSYGVALRKRTEQCEAQGISKYYIRKNKHYESASDAYWVPGCFQVLAKRNDQVPTGHIIKYPVCRLSTDQLQMLVPILCSNKINPKIYLDGNILGQIVIDFDKDSQDKDVLIEFHFYDTLLKVFAYRQSEPDCKKELELQYFSYQ